jgi:hypothetical protein
MLVSLNTKENPKTENLKHGLKAGLWFIVERKERKIELWK